MNTVFVRNGVMMRIQILLLYPTALHSLRRLVQKMQVLRGLM